MRHLGETATLVGVQVDVVHKQGGLEVGGAPDQVGGIIGPVGVFLVAELNVDLDLMILQSNQRQSQAGVTVEPELQRDVEDLAVHGGSTGGQLGQAVDVADHVGIAQLVACSLGQLIPDVKPLTIQDCNTVLPLYFRLYLKSLSVTPTAI